MALNNFLERYRTRQLKNLTIPGSHDAGIVSGGVHCPPMRLDTLMLQGLMPE